MFEITMIIVAITGLVAVAGALYMGAMATAKYEEMVIKEKEEKNKN